VYARTDEKKTTDMPQQMERLRTELNTALGITIAQGVDNVRDAVAPPQVVPVSPQDIGEWASRL
jgi:hypothetical protein